MTIAVIFDLDGPVLRLTNNEEQAYIDAVTEIYGGSPISIAWDEYPIRTDTEITKHIIKNLTRREATRAEVIKVRDKYIRNLKHKILEGNRAISIPGVVPLLQNLSKYTTLGLATGNFRDAAIARLRSGDLWRFFEIHCEGSDEEGLKTEILARLIVGLPKTITRIFFVGDSVGDLVAAEKCGVEFIGFSESEKRRNDLSATGCKLVAASHKQTEDFLLKLSSQ